VTFRSIVDQKLASRAALADAERAADGERAADEEEGAADVRAGGGQQSQQGSVRDRDGGEPAGPDSSEMDAEGENRPSFGGNF
jgi:hypothetical protein